MVVNHRSSFDCEHGDLLGLRVVQNERIAGETVAGWVDLDPNKAHDVHATSITIKIEGIAQSIIRKNHNESSPFDDIETLQLFPTRAQLLWSREAHSETNPHEINGILSIPFHFHLPSNLPPTFAAGFKNGMVTSTAQVFYAIIVEAHGVKHRRTLVDKIMRRKSVYSENPREENIEELVIEKLEREFMVRKRGTNEGIQAREQIIRTKEWLGEWREFTESGFTKQGLLGSKSCHVRAQLILPALKAFPVQTEIPFQLVAAFYSRPENSSGHHPSPTETPMPTSLELFLTRHSEVIPETAPSLLLDDSTPLTISSAKTEVDDPIWVNSPEDVSPSELVAHKRRSMLGNSRHSEYGSWKSTVRWSGSVKFDMNESFALKNISSRHELCLMIRSPSSNRNSGLPSPFQSQAKFKTCWPIELVSGFPVPPPSPDVPGERCLGPESHLEALSRQGYALEEHLPLYSEN